MRVLVAVLIALSTSHPAAPAPPVCTPGATGCEGGPPVVTTTVGDTTYTGLLYVPGDVHVLDVQRRGDGCAACAWEVITICTTIADTTDAATCDGGQSVCPVTDTYLELRLWVDGVIQDLSHWCRAPADPAPVGLDELVPSGSDLQRLVTSAPALHADPPGRVLAQLPAYVWADRSPAQSTVAVVPGYPGVTLTLVLTPATWAWDFGDGSAVGTTTDPGGPYPDGSVRHTYRRVGTFEVRVTTAWRARATLTTPLGALPSRDEPRAVSSPTGRERLTVREARAVLIGGSD